MIKKYLVFVLGLLILYLGIPMILHASIGCDPLTCFLDITAPLLNINLGAMLCIMNIIFLIIHFIKFRNIKFIIIGFIASLIASGVVNFGSFLYSNITLSNLFLQIVFFILGFFMLSFGIAIVQRSGVQKMPYEGFMEVLASIFKKDINFIRVFVEIGFAIIALIIALILKTPSAELFQYFNFGTVFIMLLTGPCVHIMYKKILKGE